MLRPISATDENPSALDRGGGLSTLARQDLTPREKEVLALMAAGWSDVEIAKRLALNSLTVRFHLSNALAKLGTTSRHEAAPAELRSWQTVAS